MYIIYKAKQDTWGRIVYLVFRKLHKIVRLLYTKYSFSIYSLIVSLGCVIILALCKSTVPTVIVLCYGRLLGILK